jgi:hypothetical protein
VKVDFVILKTSLNQKALIGPFLFLSPVSLSITFGQGKGQQKKKAT